jgi:hypothetical protein
MKSIYVHLRPDQFSFSKEFSHSNYVYSDLPLYANLSIKQTKKFLEEEPVLLDNNFINNEFSGEMESFFKLCKEKFPSFYKDPFWFLTLARLYVVFLFCKKENVSEFIHLEYDNLIYSDFTQLKNLKPSIYFTQVGPYCSSAGFVYCNSLESFEKFIIKLQQLINRGENIIRKFTQYDQLSEMIMLDLIFTHTKVMDYLPILPFGNCSENFNELQILFDSASYGQYLGGTNNGNGSGWYGLHHYIGREIANKSIDVIFENNKPFVLFDEKKIPIVNLHIHSKKLENFICE